MSRDPETGLNEEAELCAESSFCCLQSLADLLLQIMETPQCPFTKSSFTYAHLGGFHFFATKAPCLEQCGTC